MNLGSRNIVWNGRRLLVGTITILLIAGCTGGAPQSRSPDATGPTARTQAGAPDKDFARVDPCMLATLDEVSAVLGGPAHVNSGDTSDPARKSCLYIAGASDTTVWAVAVVATSRPGLARDWFQSQSKSWDDAKPVAGLGDAAFSFTNPGKYAYVEMLKGDLIVEVGYLYQGEGKAPTDMVSFIPRLTPLAAAVIRRI